MAIISKPINEVQPPNPLSSESEGAVDVPNNLSPETEGAVGLPNSLNAQSEGQVGLPNSLTSKTEGVVGAPNALSSQSEGAVDVPNNLSSESEGVVDVPNNLTGESVANPSLPNSLSSESVVNPSAPNNLTTQSAAAVSRALRPLVDMHFDDQCFSQCGEPVEFDDLFTYSRNSSASFINRRIGCNGGYEFFLDTDFVGSVTNLLTFSEQFTNVDWIKSAATINENAINSPDGDKTADKLIASAVSANHQATQVPVLASNTDITFSVYAKVGGHDRLVLIPTADDATTEKTWFNLSAGVIELVASSHIAKMTDEGDGWFQCSVTFNTGTGATANDCRIRIGKSGLVDSFLGDGVDGIHIWGAEVTESSKLQPYVKTISTSASDTFTETLRIEYDPVTGENLGALIEDASTNLLLRSEEFDNAIWIKGASTITANAIEAPDGTTSADKMIADSTASIAPKMNQSITSVTSEEYTTTFYVKKSEATFVQIFYGGGHVANDPRVNFDLTLGILGTQDADIDAATITDNGDGFFKITSTVIAAGVVLQSFLLIIQSASVSRNQAQSWNSGEGVFAWGVQIEQQLFTTSYNRTEGSTVARIMDDLKLSAIGNFNDTEGAIFCEFEIIGSETGSQYLFSIDDDSNDNRVTVLLSGTPRKLRTIVANNGSNNADYSSSVTITDNTKFKVLVNYSASKIETFLDGVSIGSDSDTLIPINTTTIHIGQSGLGADALFGHLLKMTIFDAPLTAQEVALL